MDDVKEMVEQLTKQISDFVITTSERFDKLQAGVPDSSLSVRVDEMHHVVNVDINKHIDALSVEVESLKARFDGIKQSQSESVPNEGLSTASTELVTKLDSRYKKMMAAMDMRISDLQISARSSEVTEP